MGQVNKYASTACPMFGPGKLVTDGEITRFDMYGQLYVGADTAGHDVKFFGNTTGNYLLWDESLNCLDIVSDLGTLAAEDHSVDINCTATLASGMGLVGLDVVTTTKGTAGAWASGIYAKVVQGSTKNVNGYLSAAEFEVTNSADSVSDWFVLVLNASNSGANQGSHSSYIALRDYGTTDIQSLLWVSTDHTAGSKSDTKLFTSFADGTHITHAIRFIASSTPYWILCSNVAPSGT